VGRLLVGMKLYASHPFMMFMSFQVIRHSQYYMRSYLLAQGPLIGTQSPAFIFFALHSDYQVYPGCFNRPNTPPSRLNLAINGYG
jgi:hypothetical protein